MVAGRGPMACRAIRSGQAMGAKMIAVYSEEEGSARHATIADDRILIGSADPAESYLDLRRVVEAAQVSGAAGILPVHAVLAGSAELAETTRSAGLHWFGSDPEVLAELTGAGESAEVAGLLVGLADGHHVDGVLVHRSAKHVGAHLIWTAAENDRGRAAFHATRLAELTDYVVGTGWRGLFCLSFDEQGRPGALRGGVPYELGVVEHRSGRDLVRAAIALTDGSAPPAGAPGRPAAVGGAIRATSVPARGASTTVSVVELAAAGDAVWTPGYDSGDALGGWYDPMLATVAVPGGSLAGALADFLAVTVASRIEGVPTDLDQLREQAEELAATLSARGEDTPPTGLLG